MNIRQLEANLREKQTAIKALLESQMRACADHVVRAATASEPEIKGRLRTDEEKAAVQALMDDANAIKARIDGSNADARMLAEVDRLTAGMESSQAAASHTDRPRGGTTPTFGQQFVSDPAIRAWLQGGGHRAQGMWTSPAVDLHGTLIDESSGSGGPLVVPEYLPGVVPIMFRRPVVADLIAPGNTGANAIIYMKELTATNAVAAVAEGAAKPESTLAYVQATDPVVKIATWIPVTTEMLDDFPAMQSLIDSRLRMFLSLGEEDQLLNGSGTAPNMRGIMNRTSLATAVARGADSNMDAMMKQIAAIAANALIQPDGFVMNPTNWLSVQLSKNAQGNYLGTGPWAAAQTPMLWGLPGAITPAIAANTALVGAFATCSQFFRRGGVRAAMSNSHSDFFTTNKVAVLVEERGALAVYREAAFGKVTGLS
jgi:HK97 family phage major capsid protein